MKAFEKFFKKTYCSKCNNPAPCIGCGEGRRETWRAALEWVLEYSHGTISEVIKKELGLDK